MPLGGGKYEELLADLRKKAKATSIILIVIDGEKGPGFSYQGTLEHAVKVPAALRHVAHQIEEDSGGVPV